MIHDETACIGCTACMDACREVNQVPEGVSRLEIIRSGPIGTFPDAVAWAGIALICGSGLYVLYRETVVRKRGSDAA